MMNPISTANNSDDVDAQLARYFKAEMPSPWPACQALELARHEQAHTETRQLQFASPASAMPDQRKKSARLSRLALAASLVLFFLAYFLLAGLFPAPTSRLSIDSSNDIGSNPGINHKIQPHNMKR